MIYNSLVIALMKLIYGITILFTPVLLVIGIICEIYWTAFADFSKTYWTVFAVAVVALVVCERFFASLNRKTQCVLKEINRKENLALNGEHLLGYPQTRFVAFDQHNRQLAFCHISGSYEIYDFSYVIKWDFDWAETTEVRESGNVYEAHQKRRHYTLRLYVADVDRPILTYAMESERQANLWGGRLNAIFNG